MEQSRNVRGATLLLRVSLGVMYLTHGLVLKVMTFGFAGTAAFFESIGLPGPLGYVTILAEIAGGGALVAGVLTRYVALALVPILIGAVWFHAGNGWVFSNSGGGWEYPVFLIVASAAVALLERGRVPGRHRLPAGATAAVR